MNIQIVAADDHRLFLKSLSFLLSAFKEFSIIAEALNGKDLVTKIEHQHLLPDIALLDVNMPVMDGIDTAKYFALNQPAVKCVALSMKDDDDTIIAMLKAGCCAYILKDIDPAELRKALHEIHSKGYYNADAANINYRRLILKQQEQEEFTLSEKEKLLLQYACSELPYKAIALQMNISERAIDSCRESLFRKLNVQSRTGMVLEAIRRKIVQIV